MRRIAVFSTAIAMSTMMAMTSFAGTWVQDAKGWWYQNDDGSYTQNAWVGNYYLGADGYMLTNTTTPDGYQVGADGAWIQTTASAATQTTATAHVETPEETEALKKAVSYLSQNAFSMDGLIEQLEYDGFSDSSSVYAAERCGADWNEQAVKEVQYYLMGGTFPRSTLIGHLEFAGFTRAQAEYALNSLGY